MQPALRPQWAVSWTKAAQHRLHFVAFPSTRTLTCACVRIRACVGVGVCVSGYVVSMALILMLSRTMIMSHAKLHAIMYSSYFCWHFLPYTMTTELALSLFCPFFILSHCAICSYLNTHYPSLSPIVDPCNNNEIRVNSCCGARFVFSSLFHAAFFSNYDFKMLEMSPALHATVWRLSVCICSCVCMLEASKIPQLCQY